jgi:hypothetical protein
MSGTECYESLKVSFKDCWDEINKVIHDGQVGISPGHTVPVEIFLGGDYKVKLDYLCSPVFTKTLCCCCSSFILY